jgi:hypothetical protein
MTGKLRLLTEIIELYLIRRLTTLTAERRGRGSFDLFRLIKVFDWPAAR